MNGGSRFRLVGSCVLAATLFALVPAASGAASGLGVKVDPKTGAMRIDGAAAGGSIRETTGRSGPGGRLGFLSGGEWSHATALRSSRTSNGMRTVVLRTDDPDDRRLVVTIERPRKGVQSITAEVEGSGTAPVESIGIGFRAGEGERMLGFGERSDHVDQRGNVVENYAGEGPYQTSEYPLLSVTVPPWGLRQRTDATYFPMPWMLSTRGYGVLLGNLQTSRFRLGSEAADEWSVEADARKLELQVFAGPKPRDALRRLTERIGRQPRPAAPWLFGPWVQTGHQNTAPDELSYLGILRDADAPYSAVETHMRYMPCGSDLGQEAAEKQRTAGLHATGAAALTYTREGICASYSEPFEEAVASDAFLEKADGTPYTFQAFVGSGVTQIGMFDFTDPDAGPIYASILDRAYRAGYDGWMEDYGEYAPPDSVADNGMTGKKMHNRFPVVYHREGMRYADSKKRPIIRWSRSGFTGAAKHSQIVWGGDPTTGWGFDGLSSSVREALTMGLSGVSLWGSDVGGFFTLSGQTLDPELLARWVQFGTFSGVMRTKAEGIGVPITARPQVWEEPTLPIYRRYAKLRTQLYPYLVAADRAYAKTGMPIMRQLALVYPRDRRAAGREGQYLFGPDLLVAPILEPGATSRQVYLPRGEWFDLWDAVSYREGSGDFRIGDRPEVREGPDQVVSPAPIERIPVFAKAGTLLPLLPADVETLADYGDSDHVSLGDRNDRLHVLAFPNRTSNAKFGSSGRLESGEGRGRWSLIVTSKKRMKLDLEVSMATLEEPFVPKVVRVDGERIADWDYDSASRSLEIETSIREGEITVSG